MTREDLATRIRAIISDHLAAYGLDGSVTDASTLDDLPLDSLDVLEITFAVEDEFEIELDEARLADCTTVGYVISYVARVLCISDAEAA